MTPPVPPQADVGTGVSGRQAARRASTVTYELEGAREADAGAGPVIPWWVPLAAAAIALLGTVAESPRPPFVRLASSLLVMSFGVGSHVRCRDVAARPASGVRARRGRCSWRRAARCWGPAQPQASGPATGWDCLMYRAPAWPPSMPATSRTGAIVAVSAGDAAHHDDCSSRATRFFGRNCHVVGSRSAAKAIRSSPLRAGAAFWQEAAG